MDSGPDDVSIRLLPTFVIRRSGNRLQVPLAVQRLLAYVAVQQSPASKVSIMDALWPDSPAAAATAALRTSVWRANGLCGVRLVRVDALTIELADPVDVDYRRATNVARVLLQGVADPALPESLDLVDTLTYDLLPTWDEPWLDLERSSFRQLRLDALEVLTKQALDRGLRALAKQAALAVVATDPFRLQPRKDLIEVYLSEGNPLAAIQEFRSYERVLAEELGIRPPVELANTIQLQLRSQRSAANSGRQRGTSG